MVGILRRVHHYHSNNQTPEHSPAVCERVFLAQVVFKKKHYCCVFYKKKENFNLLVHWIFFNHI